VCKNYVRPGPVSRSFAVPVLDSAANKGCPMCSLRREALRSCIPHYETGVIRVSSQPNDYFDFRWWPQGSDETSPLHIDLFTLDGMRSPALPAVYGPVNCDLAYKNGLGDPCISYNNKTKLPTMSSISGDTSSSVSWDWAVERLQQCMKTH
jgi:hypothetical protein